MKRAICGSLTALATFALGLAVVTISDSLLDRKYAVPEAQPVVLPQFQSKEYPPPRIVTDDWPPHCPRINGAELVLEGDWQNKGAPAPEKEKWLGLSFHVDNYSISEGKLRTIPFHDDNDAPGLNTGMTYRFEWPSLSTHFEGDPRPGFLVRGVPGVKEFGIGIVVFDALENGTSNRELFLDGESAHVFRVYDKDYQFRWRRGLLFLIDGERSQPIFDPELIGARTPFGPPDLLWAGDLDGDERMDFILHFIYQYDGGTREQAVLYTSKVANSREIVAPAAAFNFGGHY